MEQSPTPTPVTMGPGERLARGAVIGFLVLALGTLVFGLGMFVQDWTSDDVVAQSATPLRTGATSSIFEGSISAQFRHLRKQRFGAYAVEKRRRQPAGGTWEYRVTAPSMTTLFGAGA